MFLTCKKRANYISVLRYKFICKWNNFCRLIEGNTRLVDETVCCCANVQTKKKPKTSIAPILQYSQRLQFLDSEHMF